MSLVVTSGGAERVSNASNLLSRVFEEDPVLTYMLCSLSQEQRLAYLPTYFDSLLTAAALNKASFHEVDDWRSCGVLIPPGSKVDNPFTMLQAGLLSVLWKIGLAGCRRMLSEYAPLSDALKVKALQRYEKYYYVFFLGTRQDSRSRGLCATIVEHFKSIASRDGLPIWLEATTEYSMRLYLKLGFAVVDEFVVGKGRAAADGSQCKEGPGVRVWGMIWRERRSQGL